MKSKSEVLRDEYQKRFESSEIYRDSVWKVLCADFFSRYIAPDAVVLDLGAGWGEFSRNIKAGKTYSMDLNPDCGKRVAGFSEFIQQDCSSRWPFEDDMLDVVFTSNFLEHLPSKDLVEKTLDEAYRCLKPGGRILCLGPNIRFLPDVYWDYWDHHIPISDHSIAEVLTLHRFEVLKVVDKFLPYTMSNGGNPPILAVKAYLCLPIFWPLFGKQFFVVGRKS